MKKIFKKSLIIICLLLSAQILAQTNPVAQSLPFSQNFSTLLHTSTVYPSGFQVWNLSTTGPTTSFSVVSGIGDLSLNASSNASSTTLGAHNYNGKIGFLPGSTVNPALVLAINTTGKYNVLVGFDVMTIRNPFDASNTRICQVDFQYRIGTSGNFISVQGITNGIYQNNSTNQTTTTTSPQNNSVKSITLPSACNNQAVIQLRWVMRDFSGVNNRPSFAIDNLSICPSSLTPTITVSGSTNYCIGSQSLFTASITNGGSTPSYQWKKNGVNVGTSAASISLNGLVSGDQIQCVLTSNLSCVSSNIVNSNVITINNSTSSPVISLVNKTDASCSGVNNGAIDINISGGTAPYIINWDTINISNGGSFAVTVGPKSSTNPLFGLGNPNSYIIDGVGAKELYLTKGITYNFNVLTPSHPFHISTDFAGGSSAGIVTSGQSGAPTQNGTVVFTPNNSHPALLYYPCQFHTYMGYRINISNGYQTEDLANLSPGFYSVSVTDANGCNSASQFEILNLNASIGANSTVTPSICGNKNGAISVVGNGGQSPYTFLWDTLNYSNGPIFSVVSGTKSNTHPYFGLGSPSTFIIDGIEAKTLQLIKGLKYDFNILSPGHPWHISTDSVGGSSSSIISNGQTNAPNDNGLVSFVPSSNLPAQIFYDCANHTYMGYHINLVDGYVNSSLDNIYSGTYGLTIIDSVGCKGHTNIEVNDIPSNITLSTTILNPSCLTANDGQIDLTISGAISPYTVVWDTLHKITGTNLSVYVGSKTPVNPYYGLGFPETFFTDSLEAATLNLVKGFTYNFDVNADTYGWHISSDAIGGNTLGIINDGQFGAPVDIGSVSFKPNNSHPNLLYYTSASQEYMGNDINLLDGYQSEDLVSMQQGIYSVYVLDSAGCKTTASYNLNADTVLCELILDLTCLVQGPYIHPNQVVPKLYNLGLSSDPTAFDSILVEIRDASTYSLVSSNQGILHTDGKALINFNNNLLGQSYYIVVRHLNSIETWSKNPVPFLSSPVVFDFGNP